MHDHPREPIRLHAGHHTDDEREEQAMPQREAEQIRLVADEADRRACDRDRLRRDHLARDAARRVRRDEQRARHADLLRGGRLQRTEQRVRRRVRARQEHADPAEQRREERERRARAREQQRERRRHPRIVLDEREREHEADRQHRALQVLQHLEERAHAGARRNVQDCHRYDRRQQDRGARRREQIPVEHGGHGRRMRDDGRHLLRELVEMRDVELQRRERERAALGEHRLERLHAPDRHHHGEHDERRPRARDLRERIRRRLPAARRARAAQSPRHAAERERAAARRHEPLRARGLARAQRPPHLQERRERDEARERRGHVGQLGPDVVRREELHEREAAARDERGGPRLAHALHAVHHEHEPERQKERQKRQLASRHRADRHRIEARHLPRDDHRNPERAERDGRGIRDQAQARRIERIEAKADEQRGRDRDRRAEARRAFEKRAEREADQQHLQALIVGQRDDRAADHVELAALHDDLVEEHRGDDDPCDRPKAVREAVSRRCERALGGHPVDGDRDDERERERERARDVPLEPQHRERHEEQNDRRAGGERRPADAAERQIDLVPNLHVCLLP
ncbi:hypothetical protein DP49_5028 [Burkholderia pseudomallei]|nr:hypothetical protein DP49_5028 [Burkholderia pseudomallei]